MKTAISEKKNKIKKKNKYSSFKSNYEFQQFGHFKIPYALLNKENYPDLNYDSAGVYGILLDRLNLSVSNIDRFKDEHGIFIYYKISELMDLTNFSKSKIHRILNTLEKSKLIERHENPDSNFVNKQKKIYIYNYKTSNKKEFNSETIISDESQITKNASIIIPWLLVQDKEFSSLSFEAKALYGLLLDRYNLSVMNQNKYKDEDGDIFVIYTISEIQKKMGRGRTKAVSTLKELEDFGLLNKKSFFGSYKENSMANHIILNNFMKKIPVTYKSLCKRRKLSKPLKFPRVSNSDHRECQIQTTINETAETVEKCDSVKIGPPRVSNSDQCQIQTTEGVIYGPSIVSNMDSNTIEHIATERPLSHTNQENLKTVPMDRNEGGFIKNNLITLGKHQNIFLTANELNKLNEKYGSETQKALDITSEAVYNRSDSADVIKSYYRYTCKMAEYNGVLTVEDQEKILKAEQEKLAEQERQREEERQLNLEIYKTDDPEEIKRITEEKRDIELENVRLNIRNFLNANNYKAKEG